MESSNVKGFFDIVDKPVELKDDDQKYYVGGGKTSGLITVNPDDAKKPDKLTELISKSQSLFAEKTGKEKKVLAFWKGCFTVDETVERKYDSEQAFIDSILNGVCPNELQNFDVEVVDRKYEEYHHDGNKFTGTGQNLGSSMGTKASLSNSKKIEINPSKPTTSIRVSFANGKKAVVKLNTDHTVGDLRSHIESMEPCGKAFELRLSYPSTVLENMDQLLSDGLVGVSVIQVLQ
jgi:UBX domain-containing protein 1